MGSTRWRKLAVGGFASLAMVATACGSSNTTKSGSGGGGSSAGPSTTAPAPTGKKVAGGTVYWAQPPQGTPNYIFPMANAQVFGTTNLNQLQAMLYRPLYWYGNNESPTVDYDYSIGQKPTFSNGDKTVTVPMNSWKWSDGEPVTSRDVEFWINMYKADPAANYGAYVQGLFPDNVASMSAPNPTTLVLNLTKAYNPTWFLYNELSQISPLPLAWDRTSLTAPAPTTDTGHLPDTTKAGAEAVYKFLDAQSKAVATWATSPIWSVVDGPFKLQSFTNTGEATMVPNPMYSGSPKPTISKYVTLPYTDNAAQVNVLKSQGTGAITIGYLPPEDAPQRASVLAQGYRADDSYGYAFNFFPLNEHNPTMGPVFSQLYFRQAFQHLIDQQGWIHAFLAGTAVTTTGPIPAKPASPLVNSSASSNPYPFSVSAATKLLSSHGWKVAPGGVTTCATPGSGATQCGAGVPAGLPLTFNLDYAGGIPSTVSEMNDLAAQAKKVGITIQLTSHPFSSVIGAATQCMPSQPTCKWTAENWGAGWIYAPDFLPTGESLFQAGASANYSNYSDLKTDSLIGVTTTGPQSSEQQNLTTYAKYMAQQLPVVYGPTSEGNVIPGGPALISKKLGGYDDNAFGYLTPESYYLTQ